MVINKGSERVSEVTARFTLDAMPGKQMAIDADLNTGAINDMHGRDWHNQKYNRSHQIKSNSNIRFLHLNPSPF